MEKKKRHSRLSEQKNGHQQRNTVKTMAYETNIIPFNNKKKKRNVLFWFMCVFHALVVRVLHIGYAKKKKKDKIYTQKEKDTDREREGDRERRRIETA